MDNFLLLTPPMPTKTDFMLTLKQELVLFNPGLGLCEVQMWNITHYLGQNSNLTCDRCVAQIKFNSSHFIFAGYADAGQSISLYLTDYSPNNSNGSFITNTPSHNQLP